MAMEGVEGAADTLTRDMNVDGAGLLQAVQVESELGTRVGQVKEMEIESQVGGISGVPGSLSGEDESLEEVSRGEGSEDKVLEESGDADVAVGVAVVLTNAELEQELGSVEPRLGEESGPECVEAKVNPQKRVDGGIDGSVEDVIEEKPMTVVDVAVGVGVTVEDMMDICEHQGGGTDGDGSATPVLDVETNAPVTAVTAKSLQPTKEVTKTSAKAVSIKIDSAHTHRTRTSQATAGTVSVSAPSPSPSHSQQQLQQPQPMTRKTESTKAATRPSSSSPTATNLHSRLHMYSLRCQSYNLLSRYLMILDGITRSDVWRVMLGEDPPISPTPSSPSYSPSPAMSALGSPRLPSSSLSPPPAQSRRGTMSGFAFDPLAPDWVAEMDDDDEYGRSMGGGGGVGLGILEGELGYSAYGAYALEAVEEEEEEVVENLAAIKRRRGKKKESGVG
ncbi:hypothetical protein HK102_011002, partial [Quaeritorhiza haematococci]